jgi:hypothetical protein
MATMQAGISGAETSMSERIFLDEPTTPTTRYLCAGTYLNEVFRDWVLKYVYAKTGSRVAPSYGFDVVPVVAHARNAWLISTAQNGCLTILLVIAAWYSAPSTAFLFTSAYLWFLIVNVRAYVKQRMSRFFRLPHHKDDGLYRESMYLAEERGRIRENAFILLPLIGGTVALTLWLDWGIGDVLRGAVSIIVLAAIVYGVAELGRFQALHGLRLHRNLQPIALNRRLKTIDAQQHGPVVAHFENPFIGSGQIVHAWAFSQHLLRPKDDDDGPKGSKFAEPPFRTKELVHHIRDGLRQLAENKGEETELPGLDVKDLLLVEGRHLGRYEPLLSRLPDLTEFEEFMADSRAPGRHHLACQIKSWGGEIVTTVYLHTSLQGGLLYLRYTIYALTPTPREFQMIDEVGKTGARAMTKAVLGKLAWAPRALLAPREFWRAIRMAGGVLKSPKDRTINARHNVGVVASAREHLTEAKSRSYFQELDVAKHSKIIERRIISSVGEFLKGKVLTDEYEERTTHILNSGVLNMGSGDITIGDDNTIGGNP